MAFTTTCLWISGFVDRLTNAPPDILFHRLRLVMPPTLFFLLSFPVTRLAHALFPAAFSNGAISGAFVFCKLRAHFVVHHSHLGRVDVIYDSMHYAYATFRLRVRVFLTRSSFQHASHQASSVSQGAEKVSLGSSLQKLRAWFWRHQYAPSAYYRALSNV